MKHPSNKFVSIVYHISVALLTVKYLVIIGVICITQKKLSARLGIAVPVIIFWVFHITKRAHICCSHLVYYAPALLTVGI